MDLEERLAEAVRAATQGKAADVLAERFTYDAGGRRGGRDEALAWFAGRKPDEVTLRVVSVKRNLLFLDWQWAGVGAGVAIVAWDQDGRVASLNVQRR